MAPRPPDVYVEIPGAERHPTCQPGGRLIAMPQINAAPWADVVGQTRAAIAYARLRNIGVGPDPLVVRIDAGITFADVGRKETGNGTIPRLVGITAAEAIRGYETGCLDYRRRVNIPNGWVGCEFDNLCKIAAEFSAAGLTNVVIYLDALAEFTLDLWSQGARPEIDQAIAGIAASPMARRRGFTANTEPREFSMQWYGPSRNVTTTTGERMLRDSGLLDFGGRFYMFHTANAGGDCVRDDGRVVPGRNGARLADGQFSNLPWYAEGAAVTAACVEAKHIHRMHGVDYWPTFSAASAPLELKARVRFGTPDRCTLWGDATALPALIDLAAAITAWST